VAGKVSVRGWAAKAGRLAATSSHADATA